jgi:hypothetical protein
MKKTSTNTIKYYRLNLEFNKLSYDGHYGESIALGLKDYYYARINLKSYTTTYKTLKYFYTTLQL